jgi:hypothetical protein
MNGLHARRRVLAIRCLPQGDGAARPLGVEAAAFNHVKLTDELPVWSGWVRLQHEIRSVEDAA